MPILHVQYDAEGQTPDGQKIKIPARVALLQNGPCVKVVIGLGQSLAEQLVQQGHAVPQTGTPLVIYSEGKTKKLRIKAKPTTRRAA